ncbi:MAG TPA: DciA family protein [Rhizomicrobium sp.]
MSRDAVGVGSAAFARAGFSDPTLVLRWDDIVGPEIARIARPLRLSEGASGAVLTLKAEPAAALFLQHETRVLCDRINGWLKHTQVTRLRFVQGPLADRPRSPRPAPARGEVSPGDPVRGFEGTDGLKSALLGLAEARRPPKD